MRAALVIRNAAAFVICYAFRYEQLPRIVVAHNLITPHSECFMSPIMLNKRLLWHSLGDGTIELSAIVQTLFTVIMRLCDAVSFIAMRIFRFQNFVIEC